MKISLIALMLSVLLFSSFAHADSPTILTCKSVGKASADYMTNTLAGLAGNIGEWDSKKDIFTIGTPNKPNELTLRDKVFSNLDTEAPLIKSMTPEAEPEEFRGQVVARYEDTVFLKWVNNFVDPNKVWLAAINREHKVAVVTQVYQGMTSIGVDSEALECK